MEQMISPRTFLDESRREYNQSFRTRCGGGYAPSEMPQRFTDDILTILETCNSFIRDHECDHFAEEDNVYVGDSMFPDHHMHQKRIRAAQEDQYLLARAKRQFKRLGR